MLKNISNLINILSSIFWNYYNFIVLLILCFNKDQMHGKILTNEDCSIFKYIKTDRDLLSSGFNNVREHQDS